MKYLYLIVPIAGIILLNMLLGKIRGVSKKAQKNEDTEKLRKRATVFWLVIAAVAALVWAGIWLIMAYTFK